VVSARSILLGCPPSATITPAYFIDSITLLAVLSLASDPASFLGFGKTPAIDHSTTTQQGAT
jgi:hypothetical protein